MSIVTNEVTLHISIKNMLGDNPERSFLGKFPGWARMPNSNFFTFGGLNHHVVPWLCKDTKIS